MRLLKFIKAVLLAGVFALSLEATANSSLRFTTPTKKVPTKEWPRLTDDLHFEEMELAIDRQLKRFSQKNLNGTVRLGKNNYPLRRAPQTLERFKEIVKNYRRCLGDDKNKNNPEKVKKCEDQLNKTVKSEFNLYTPDLKPEDPRFGEPKPTFFTGYYTPTLDGRDRPTATHPYGVYKRPTDSLLAGKTRVEIDFDKVLEGKGLDLFYTKDLFDIYLLHVQGGGKVNMKSANGKTSSFYISYNGTNNRPFTFISKYMREMGYITDPSVEAQRNFLLANPDRQREIYATSPNYVYFKVSDHPPFGNDSVPLTDNRSIATDSKLYNFKGLLSFVDAERPREDRKKDEAGKALQQPFQRFFLDQDTGGSIKGKARVDLYFGEDSYAEYAAYNTTNRGDLYFLMLK